MVGFDSRLHRDPIHYAVTRGSVCVCVCVGVYMHGFVSDSICLCMCEVNESTCTELKRRDSIYLCSSTGVFASKTSVKS